MRPVAVPPDRLPRLVALLSEVEASAGDLTAAEALELSGLAFRAGALLTSRHAALTAAAAAAPAAPEPSSAPGSRLVDASEAAALLRVSKSTVTRLAAAGKLPVVRPSPGVVRFDRGDLEAYAVKCRGRGNTAQP